MIFSTGLIHQLLAASTACLSAVSIGMAYGFTSPNLERWLSPESDIKMTVEQSSWVVSFVFVGTLASIIPSGFLVNLVGRKMMLLALGILHIVSWLIILFTRTVEALYVARFIQGCVSGPVLSILPLYLGEIADVKVRGMLGTMVIGSYNIGVLLGYILGSYLDYNQLIYANLALLVVFIVSFINMPSTPYFLVMKNKIEAAKKSLAWLRGKKEDFIKEELSVIETSLSESKMANSNYKDLYQTSQGRKAMIIVLTVNIVLVSTGFAAILAFASYIFKLAGKSFLSPNQFTIIVGVVQVVAVFFSGPTVDRLGRRFILIGGILICGICQAIAAAFFFLKTSTSIDTSSYTWLPVVVFSIFFFFNTAGTGSMFGVLQPELFPTNLRGLAASISLTVGTIIGFFSIKMYQELADNNGIYLNHVIFSVTSFIGLMVIVFILPETKGLTFDEIQIRLGKEKITT